MVNAELARAMRAHLVQMWVRKTLLSELPSIRAKLLRQSDSGALLRSLSLLRVLAIAMTLHGMYDTFVGHPKLDVWALLVALLSFAWLGWQIETCREEEQQALAALEGGS